MADSGSPGPRRGRRSGKKQTAPAEKVPSAGAPSPSRGGKDSRSAGGKGRGKAVAASSAPRGGGRAQRGHRSASVDIPREMFDWSMSESGRSFADVVREKAGVESVECVVLRQGKAQFVVSASDMDTLRAGRALLEFRLQQEIALHEQRRLKERLVSEMASVEEEVRQGRRAEFKVPREALGLVIGKGGANIARLEGMDGIERVVIDKDTCTVRIKGTPGAVAAAKADMNFVVERIPIVGSQVGFVVGAGGSTIRDIQSRSQVMQIDIVPRGAPLPRPGDAPVRSSGPSDPLDIVMLGRKGAVDTACMLYEAHMESLFQADELAQEVSELSRELQKVDVAYGDAAPQPRQRYGRGRRGGSEAPASQGRSKQPASTAGSRRGNLQVTRPAQSPSAQERKPAGTSQRGQRSSQAASGGSGQKGGAKAAAASGGSGQKGGAKTAAASGGSGQKGGAKTAAAGGGSGQKGGAKAAAASGGSGQKGGAKTAAASGGSGQKGGAKAAAASGGSGQKGGAKAAAASGGSGQKGGAKTAAASGGSGQKGGAKTAAASGGSGQKGGAKAAAASGGSGQKGGAKTAAAKSDVSVAGADKPRRQRRNRNKQRSQASE